MVKRNNKEGVSSTNPEPEYITYPVRIRVISQKGACFTDHKVGQEWVCAYEPGPPKIPDICPAALLPILYNLKALWWGAPIPAPVPDPDTFYCCCPDPLNPVVFELKRLIDQPIRIHFSEKLDVYKDRKKIESQLKS